MSERERKPFTEECSESVSGHSGEQSSADGRCRWCGLKVYGPAPRPVSFEESELSEAYGIFFDPDYEPYEPPRRGPLRAIPEEWT